MNKYFKISLIMGAIFSIVLILFCNYVIKTNSENSVFDDSEKIPFNKVGLLLGTSKDLLSGKPNQYFTNRIDATIKLYNTGKIKYVIISGDNGKDSYNEPAYMKAQLQSKGLPDSCIFLDFAGFRTFDSVVRCKEIFGQNRITIISQRFHSERAIYIAKHFDIDAVGFNAKDVDVYNGFKTKVRELFARVKVFIDIFIIHSTPKFLGNKIIIP